MTSQGGPNTATVRACGFLLALDSGPTVLVDFLTIARTGQSVAHVCKGHGRAPDPSTKAMLHPMFSIVSGRSHDETIVSLTGKPHRYRSNGVALLMAVLHVGAQHLGRIA
jgi:hypothetical protein